jgi:hypothetical protein
MQIAKSVETYFILKSESSHPHLEKPKAVAALGSLRSRNRPLISSPEIRSCEFQVAAITLLHQ